MSQELKSNDSDKLAVIWSSADREVALKMVFMYTRNAKLRGWWDEVRLVVWGPSVKLLSEDEELQAYIKNMKTFRSRSTWHVKRVLIAMGPVSKLIEFGIDVIYMGEPLTSMLKDGWKSITF